MQGAHSNSGSGLTRSATVFLFGVIAASLCGCGGDDEPAPERQNGDGGRPPPGWLAAVGTDGTLAYTFDDASWSVRRIAERDLATVACVGNELGWVAGGAGLVLHTADGGQSWHEQASGLTADLYAIAFAAEAGSGQLVGVVGGGQGALAVSRDAGATYRVVASGTTATLRAAAMAHEMRLMLLVGDAGTVLRSTNGESFALHTIAGAGDLRDVSLDASGHLALAVDAAGNVWASHDSGSSFVREHASGAGLRGVSVNHPGTWALAVGDLGRAFVREPIGRWTSLETHVDVPLEAALVAHDGTRFYAAGASGTLLRSPDRGSSWTRVALSTSATLRALEDLDPH